MITGIISILFWMILVPTGGGLLITAGFSDKTDRLLRSCLLGMVAYLAIFQILIVPNMLTVNNFFEVCTAFSYTTIVLAVCGVGVYFVGIFRKKTIVSLEKKTEVSSESKRKKIETVVLWGMFCVVVMFQLVQAVRLTFPDGDDAYYVGVATYGAEISKMFSKIPYTGAYTEFDTRHCLAPFSYIISFLSRVSGLETSVIAHSVLPVLFILLAYGIYLLIAKQICNEKREVPLVMLVSSIILMFGNYSVYSMETFLMTRIRQGKASLGSFVFPLGFYFLLLLAKRKDGRKKERVILYILLALNGFVAALFSTMGNFIYPCMVVLGGICVCISQKNIKKIFPILLTCIPSGVMAALYFVIR